MDKLPTLPTDPDILIAVERWIDDLAAGRYDTAFARTSSLIRAVIQGYGLPEPHRRGPFEVTDRNSATGQRAFEVERVETPPEVIAFVSHNLPLNGEWSDLTVT